MDAFPPAAPPSCKQTFRLRRGPMRPRGLAFGRNLHIVIPWTTDANFASTIPPLLSRSHYYRCVIALEALLEPELRAQFFVKGHFTAISDVRAWSQSTNIVRIHGGKLTLSMEEQQYHQLGLDGRRDIPSRRLRGATDFVVDVDLRTNDPPNRVKWALSSDRIPPVSLLFSWVDENGNRPILQGLPGASEFHQVDMLPKIILPPATLPCPNLKSVACRSRKDQEEALLDVFQWCGLCVTSCTHLITEEPGSVVSDSVCGYRYIGSKDTHFQGHPVALAFQGLVDEFAFVEAFRNVRDWVKSASADAPWSYIGCWGFEHDPAPLGPSHHFESEIGSLGYAVIVPLADFGGSDAQDEHWWDILSLGNGDLYI